LLSFRHSNISDDPLAVIGARVVVVVGARVVVVAVVSGTVVVAVVSGTVVVAVVSGTVVVVGARVVVVIVVSGTDIAELDSPEVQEIINNKIKKINFFIDKLSHNIRVIYIQRVFSKGVSLKTPVGAKDYNL
jgi:hypothetical protein